MGASDFVSLVVVIVVVIMIIVVVIRIIVAKVVVSKVPCILIDFQESSKNIGFYSKITPTEAPK